MIPTTILSIETPLDLILHTISEIETGTVLANKDKPCRQDHKVGSYKEITRYQITPSIWARYSNQPRQDYLHDKIVARQILSDRLTTFWTLKKRNPSIKELYILWHRPAIAYNSSIVPTNVKKRAERFENLLLEYMKYETK